MSPIIIDAGEDKVRQYLDARERRATASRAKLKRYYDDPVAFISDCVDFKDKSLTPYQAEVIGELPDKKRVCQRGPHGLGKTTTAALLVHWFALTRDAMCASGDSSIGDWKCPITAGAWRQLEKFLWPEIHKWARVLRWDKIGRDPYKRTELLRQTLQLDFGEAFATASSDPGRIEGAHADAIFYIFDEAKMISDATFDAAEGALAGAGKKSGLEAFSLVSSTPGEPIGRFYDIQMGKKGFKDWWPRHVTLEEAMAAGRIDEDWVEQRKEQWGEKSQLFHNRVLGEFFASEEDCIIPLRWVEMATTRWEDNQTLRLEKMDRLGVDVAGQGKDKTVLARIHGWRVDELIFRQGDDTLKVEKRVISIAKANPDAIVTIDADGMGVGVFEHVEAELGPDRVKAFHASGATEAHDSSGQLEFINVRAAAWWKMREMLNPERNPTLELPPDDQLVSDLSTPKWKESQRGKIQVESKADVKKRLDGRSTDAADAVVMGYWKQRKKRRRRMGNMGFGDEESTAA